MEPGYLKLYQTGELKKRAEALWKRLESCRLCPRCCGVNRLKDELGVCQTGHLPRVSSAFPHFGEERVLVGTHGSGTIFFSSCNLRCVFCQNYEISHLMEGEEISLKQLAGLMLYLQGLGCHNINLVTPTHMVPHIVEALSIAIEGSLKLPLVYNTGGYDSLETLQLLDEIIDIYMPDFKFADEAPSATYLNAKDYPDVAKAAIREMHRQVGDLVIDASGIAQRGLLVRHLVMPENLAATQEVMRFLSREISKNTFVNIMDQYRPCGEAHRFAEIRRRITQEEFAQAIAMARKEGLHRIYGE